MNPIFIVGCPRSGTTLLQQMLNAHSQVAIAPETHFIRRFWLKREIYGDLARDSNYGRLLDDLCAMPEFLEMGLDPCDFHRVARLTTRSFPALFTLLLEQFGHKQEARYVGEKTPNHLLYLTTLQTFFPSVRFVYVVRDPRAVVNSWRKVPWSSGSLIGDAAVWRRYGVTARRQAPSVRHLFLLRYEDLVNEPETCLRVLCKFLRIEFEANMMSFYEVTNTLVNTAREPWKATAVDDITTVPLNRWKRELSPVMIAQIEAVAWPAMRRFGYKIETGPVQLAYWSMFVSAILAVRKTIRAAYRLAQWQA